MVGRLAPSPTGGLHLGHARTFLIAWLAARQAGGPVVLRIEDLDASRVRAEAKESMLDRPRPGSGSTGTKGRMSAAPRPLMSNPNVRPFYDGASTVSRRRERLSLHLHAGRHRAGRQCPARGGRRPELSRDLLRPRRSPTPSALGDRPVRLAIPRAPGPVAWHDLFLGRSRSTRPGRRRLHRRPERFGPAYQLAVVVDDAAMGVNQVIRGADLVPSTPRQILLFRRLGWAVPNSAMSPWCWARTAAGSPSVEDRNY